MNSTSKVILIAVGAILVIWVIFLVATPNNQVAISNDQSASTTDTTNTTTPKPSSGSNNGTNSGTNVAVNNTTKGLSDSALLMIIKNSSVRVPQTGVDVTLTDGGSDFTNNNVKGHLAIGNVLGKVGTDNGYDVFVEMILTTNGSPVVMHYVGLFQNTDQTVAFKSAASIGDRLVLNGVSASIDKSVMVKNPLPYMNSSAGYNVTLSYLDRKAFEVVTATPTVQSTLTLHVKNHNLTK